VIKMKNLCLGRIIPRDMSVEIFDKALSDLDISRDILPILYQTKLVGYIDRLFRKENTLFCDITFSPKHQAIFECKLSSYRIEFTSTDFDKDNNAKNCKIRQLIIIDDTAWCKKNPNLQ